jgi:UDP-N-acetylmuramyl pentapeptide phosphotransferase/UDP-N-acetylglucosamine-1-phosphate transferase
MGRLFPWTKKELNPGGHLVPCLLLILFLAFPRIALVWLFFTSNYLQRAYHGPLLPLLGFLFLPLTTLAYAWMTNTRQPIEGINLLILVVAVVIDVGGLGGGEYHRRRNW